MATYTELVDEIYAEFASTAWTDNGINAYPADYNGKKDSNEYVTISIILGSSERQFGGGKGPQSGLLYCEIYTQTGEGQKAPMRIADALDTLLENKFLACGAEFHTSYLGIPSIDQGNVALSRTEYTISFETYGTRN